MLENCQRGRELRETKKMYMWSTGQNAAGFGRRESERARERARERATERERARKQERARERERASVRARETDKDDRERKAPHGRGRALKKNL